MSLTLTRAAQINESLTEELRDFAATPVPGKVTRNSEQAAWSLFLAQRMVAYAEAFKKQATADAVSAGVLFDHSKEPRKAGTDEDIYSGDFVRVHLRVKKGSSRVDMKKLELALVSSGVLTQAAWDMMIERCTIDNAPPHTFTASLKT